MLYVVYVRYIGVHMVCFPLEYNPLEAPKLNEKVLKDKRKKLKETFQRVMKLYVSIRGWDIKK